MTWLELQDMAVDYASTAFPLAVVNGVPRTTPENGKDWAKAFDSFVLGYLGAWRKDSNPMPGHIPTFEYARESFEKRGMKFPFAA